MDSSTRHLHPSAAARQLGVSVKALRVYEQKGLVVPARSPAGWRMYGTEDLQRAAQVVALRALGLTLAQVARALKGHAPSREPVLAQHQAALEARMREIAGLVGQVQTLRNSCSNAEGLAQSRPRSAHGVAFELPWPWKGEVFELQDIRAINYIVGPLFSGKTRLAQRLAERLPNAVFIGLDRAAAGAAAAKARLQADAALSIRVATRLASLVERGANASDALLALVVELDTEGPDALVVDMIEQGLDQATQEALAVHLRRQGSATRPLFCLTRSSSLLDLRAVGPDETVIFCPPNHSPPFLVAPHAGAPGYEAVAMCLGTPSARARTEGVVVCWPQAA
ncbi:MerR family transcriptional regulator [Variovorax sp. LT2P21]|uniref:MerR family transcriptional regulator n=1 Tax=Variovorax sp. LT2P21 TaxID=3443731 RepID=UPI003F47ED1D